MDHPLLTTFILVSGLALALLAQWRGWRPSLRTALAVGIGLRLVLLALAAADSWQATDFVLSFKPAGEAILNREDPVLSTGGAWRFLPMIPYAYAIPLALGIPWEVSGRLVTLLADVVLIVLVGKLARGQAYVTVLGRTIGGVPEPAVADRREALARFQYACNPIALLVSVIHGQVEPVSLVFLVGAYLAARSGRGLAAGALFGLALSAKSWPIILFPVVLVMLPGWRRRIVAGFAAAAVPLLFLASLPLGAGTSWSRLPEIFETLRWVRPIVGEWGWTAIATGGNWELNADYASIGQKILYLSLLVVVILWRRADRVDLTVAMLLMFMVVTPRLGAQYLLWFVPFLLARPTRFAQPALAAAAVWAGLGYIYLTQFDPHNWYLNHQWWAQGSVLVIPLLLLAMPWGRFRAQLATPTRAEPDRPDAPGSDSPESAAQASDGPQPDGPGGEQNVQAAAKP